MLQAVKRRGEVKREQAPIQQANQITNGAKMRKRLEVLELEHIIQDIEKDVKTFNNQPFTGKAVGAQFGYQAAAIQAIARIVKTLIEEKQNE